MAPPKFDFSRITDAADARVPAFMRIFENAFPVRERRAAEHWLGAFRDPLCRARLYESVPAKKTPVAILVFWDFGHCRYVEYFAVAETERGNGVGSAVLKNFIAESGVPVVLEIEPPEENEKNARRLEFYMRCGFVANAGAHFHPPYRAGFSRERLVILNCGANPLTPEARERFVSDLENRAMRYAVRES